MQLFLCNNSTDTHFTLEDDDYRHCIKALRKKVGDQIIATDGNGQKIEGQISSIGKRSLEVEILSKSFQEPAPYKLHIAIAPTKNMSRFEWFLEKATEIGFHHIHPIQTRYSERKALKLERCNKILVSAMKQSQQFYLPQLSELQSYKQFINNTEIADKYIAYVDQENIHLQDRYQKTQEVLILIGPEGDFSKEEIDMALSQNYLPVSLGNNRLRTETAGIVAAQIVAGLNRRFKGSKVSRS